MLDLSSSLFRSLWPCSVELNNTGHTVTFEFEVSSRLHPGNVVASNVGPPVPSPFRPLPRPFYPSALSAPL